MEGAGEVTDDGAASESASARCDLAITFCACACRSAARARLPDALEALGAAVALAALDALSLPVTHANQ